MKPRILLTGKDGQIGTDLRLFLPPLGDLVALGSAEVNLADAMALRRAVADVRPDLIVNAAAYTAVDQAEREPSLAHAVNAQAPAVLAEEAKKVGAALIHFSTDYVFDGSRATPYTEADTPNPLSVYGASKLAGEQAVAASGVPHLILRTAWVYARHRRNFLLTILRLAAQQEELRVVRDQVGAPAWSREVAAAISRILASLPADLRPADALRSATGLYHLAATGAASWHQFAQAILEEATSLPRLPAWATAATQGRPLVARLTPISTAEYPTAARRPAYSVLSSARIEKTFGVCLPDWRTQLRSVFQTV